jgi:putative Holliday junction resolvase
MRALGVDLGSRRIGLALSDPSGTTAAPLAVIDRGRRHDVDHDAILGMARANDVEVIVVGFPLSLDGEVGPAARRVLSEVDELRRAAAAGPGEAMRVEVHDERLSTVTAERALTDAGVDRQRRRRDIDKAAAAVILQSWLDARGGP